MIDPKRNKGFWAVANKDRTGFHWRLPNGYTLSVQFGRGNYSSNRNESDISTSETVETAVIDPSGELVTKPGEHDSVQPYQTSADVLKTLEWALSLGK